MKRKSIYHLLSILTAGSLLSGCAAKGEEITLANADVKVVEATTTQIQTMNRILELSGSLEPMEDTLVSFEVGGRILQLNKEEGDSVKAGEILGKLDDADYKLQVQKAGTAVEQAQATLAKVQNGARQQELTQAQLLVDKAQVNNQKAQDDLKKMEQLYQNGAISKDTWENAQIRAEMAGKDLETTQASLSLAQAGARQEDKIQTSALYEQMVIQKEQAELAQQKASLQSPMTGTIIAKLASMGQLTGAGNPVYRVGRMDQLKAVLPVPDRDVSLWKIGDKIDVVLYGDKRIGTVQKVYPSTNAGTGTVGVEVVIDNADQKWLVGQVVRATHQIQNGKGLFVPVEAVVRSGGEKPFVFVVQNKKAIKTEVEIGQLRNNRLEIQAGLKEGQSLVTKGADRLFDGDAIEVVDGGKSK